jgi:hypothetical protein
MVVSSPSIRGCLFGTHIPMKMNNKESHIISDVLQAIHVYLNLLV